jgi:hypothetical protein
MLTCNLMGGLGNQLFQIFITISYAIKSKQSFKFTNAKTLGQGSTTLRHTYWETFLSKLKPFLTESFPKMIVIREDNFVDYKIPIEFIKNNDIMFYGYFQSYKYFENEFDTIIRLIDLNKLKANILSKLNFNNTNTISMHFRLGDYKKLQDYHPIMSYEYYENSIQYILTDIQNNMNIIYFCENDDINEVDVTIQKLKNKFKNINFVRANNELTDWEQMLLMSLCRHNIIANSTFSWWGAYFNSNSEKIVCYPSIWYGEKANIDTTNMFPPSWTKIKA